MIGRKTLRRWMHALAALLVAVIAGVHLQQYIDFMSQVPTVGVLFLLNAAGGAGLAVALLSRERLVRLLAALGATGLALGSLVSLAIALKASFFGYSEPTLRAPLLIAIIAEAAVLPALATIVHGPRREPARPEPAGSRTSRA